MKQKDDPTIERIRETRHQISEAHEDGPQKIVEYYLELQKKFERQLLKNAEETPTESVRA